MTIKDKEIQLVISQFFNTQYTAKIEVVAQVSWKVFKLYAVYSRKETWFSIMMVPEVFDYRRKVFLV